MSFAPESLREPLSHIITRLLPEALDLRLRFLCVPIKGAFAVSFDPFSPTVVKKKKKNVTAQIIALRTRKAKENTTCNSLYLYIKICNVFTHDASS